MKHLGVILVAAVVLVATLACSISIPIPITQIKTGPTVSKSIEVPPPSVPSHVTYLTMAFGAGELNLSPGAADQLVQGMATYNVADFEPKVTVSGNDVRIEQGQLDLRGFPDFGPDGVKNTWDLKLGQQPVRLRITAGAYRGDMELGGLALEELYVSDGASTVNLSFSEPNLIEMTDLRYETGASTVDLKGLANANFATMQFRAGAGSYTLDFSGDLQRDADVTIESGLSTVDIVVPTGTAARVTFEGGLSDVNAVGGWKMRGGAFEQAGSGPRLTIAVKMGAGTVNLSN
jgi:hypothetical protein